MIFFRKIVEKHKLCHVPEKKINPHTRYRPCHVRGDDCFLLIRLPPPTPLRQNAVNIPSDSAGRGSVISCHRMTRPRSLPSNLESSERKVTCTSVTHSGLPSPSPALFCAGSSHLHRRRLPSRQVLALSLLPAQPIKYSHYPHSFVASSTYTNRLAILRMYP